MPFARVSLKSLISRPYDLVPISVGDHIRKKRLELGLLQKEAALQLEVNPWTVLNWEKGYTEPPVSAMPAIFRFLGYEPFPEPRSLPECLLAKRRQMGWTIKEAARNLGADPGTWGNWERGKMILYRKHRVSVALLLGVSIEDLHQEMSNRWGRLHNRIP